LNNATAPSEVAGQVVKVVDTLKGSRQFRVFVDPADDGAEEVFRMGDRVRQWFYQRIGMLVWSALEVQRHRNRLASDHLHEHAIAVHYDDPDVVLIGNNRRVRPAPTHANGLTAPLLSTKTRSAGTSSGPTPINIRP